MTGLNKYDQKDKRKQRRRNHITKDLMSPKYRQRVVPTYKDRYEVEFRDYDDE